MGRLRANIAASVLVAAIIVGALFFSVFIPSNANGQEVILRTTTSVSTVTAVVPTTVTTTATSTLVAITTSISIFTMPLPATVTVAGTAKANAPGATANTITFSVDAGPSVASQVTDGRYSVDLPNGLVYHIVIAYSGIPVGGSCSPGVLYISTVDKTVNATFAC